MSDQTPRSKEDREVLVVRGDERERARLRAWYDGHDGPIPRYRLELNLRWDLYTATATDLFECLVRLRRQLEPDGWQVAVQGSRLDAYPSGMARDQGGGQRVYVMRHGRQAKIEDLVDTFADAEVDQLASIEDQKAFVTTWLALPRSAD
jgi:hypothetical protein